MNRQVVTGAAGALALLIGCAVAASAQDRTSPPGITPSAATDPLKLIYLFPGARETGNPNPTPGITTAIHCTSFSTVQERLQVFARNFSGGGVAGSVVVRFINPFETRTVVTHTQNVFREDNIMNSGPLDQGEIVVNASTIRIVCSAEAIDGASGSDNGTGVAIHPIRFNPVASTQE